MWVLEAVVEELRSYAEALLAWLDGKPIQYLEVNSHWYDWDGPILVEIDV